VRDRAAAEALDAEDPLARWRDEFVIGDPELVYLDGNSLGMAPRRTADALAGLVAGAWGTGLIRSWDRWVDLPLEVGAELAPLLGADGGEVVVHDSTTINLYQLVWSALDLHPDGRVIAIDPSEFPTDRYVVDGIAARAGLEVRPGYDDLDGVAVVVRSAVDFRTAEVADLGAETERARSAGALVVWDLSHAAGVLELDLHAAGVELAVGCTYKFLCSGPGGPAFSYVARELLERVRSPIQGWFGQRDQFAMGPAYVPRDDVGRLMIGTSGILGLTAARCGIEVVTEAGLPAIRAKAAALTRFGLELCERWGLESPTPRDAARRGGHLSIRHPDALALTARLAERNVIVDHRPPGLLRLGCSPLTTRFVDVHDGVAAIADLVS